MQATTEVAPLPRWNLDIIFPGPSSPEFRAALDAVARQTADLAARFDRHGVGSRQSGAIAAPVFEEIVDRYNALLDDAYQIEGYLFCLVAADVRDEAAQAAAGEWRQRKVELGRLAPRFTAWVGGLDRDALAARSETARAHASALQRLQQAAGHLMAPGEEDLAAALGPSGAAAWMALRDDLAGRAMATIELDGVVQELPLSEIDNLAYHPEREVRRRAFEADAATARALAVPFSAALNGVKGQQATLALRRGWDDPLDDALFLNAVDRPILDALMVAIQEALPEFRRYLRAKARFLGVPVLAGYDLHAPVGEAMAWPFPRARSFIVDTFRREHAPLGALAERAFAEDWIDAAPRAGKDGGAFAMPVGGDESRIFANYLPVYDWMGALAHELGHAYHVAAIVHAGRTPLQAPLEMTGTPLAFPMTLAETASTICEAMVQRAARAEATPAQEVALLDGWLQSVSLNVFGTMAYFQFEREVFATRQQRELTADELERLMAVAWRDLCGDAIAPETVRSFAWTAPHFFIDGTWYYNFPYAFGMLFALGLLAARDANPGGFYARFDGLLADSGMCEANALAARFGFDLRDAAFWRASLDVFRADVDRFEALADGG
jgi:pepF/M3 family oligoendopeptidase